MEVEVPKWHVWRSTWSTDIVMRGAKIGGLVEKCSYNKSSMIYFYFVFWALYISLPSRYCMSHKAHFSASMCYHESWEVSLPSMCLHHILAHETHLCYLALASKPAPTCFQTTWGHLELKNPSTHNMVKRVANNAQCTVQHKVHVTCKLHWTCINWIPHSFFVNCFVRRFASHVLTHLTKSEGKWSPREDKKTVKLTLFFQNCLFFGIYQKKINTFVFLVHGHSSWSIFGLHLVRGPKALCIGIFNRLNGREAIFHRPTSWSMV